MDSIIRNFWAETYYEFDHLGDYIWKFNEQIDELRKIEMDKLDDYFPDDPHGQAIRWESESQKLDYSFPSALNYSFVVLVFITIEVRLMKICDLIYQRKSLSIRAKDLAGSNFDRYMNFLDKLAGVSRNNLQYWEQISILEKIRNCIVHTSGFVSDSKDAVAITNLVRNQSYLSKEHRESRKKFVKSKGESASSDIEIRNVSGGERLLIKKGYSHLVSFYGREFLKDVLVKSQLLADPSKLSND